LIDRLGNLQTLDREHFYPTIEAGLAAIAAGEEGSEEP